jgi:hypothetical protein
LSSPPPPTARLPPLVVGLLIALVGAAVACTSPNPDYERAPDAAPAPFDAHEDTSDGTGGATHLKDGPSADVGTTPSDVGQVGTGDAEPNRDGASQDRGSQGPNLVGAWHFEEGVGSPIAADSSYSGAVGTLTGMDPATAWIPGRKGGNALAFEPTTAAPRPSVRVALVPGLKDLRRFTVAAWIYRTGTSKPAQMSAFSQQRTTDNDEIFNLCIVNDDAVVYLPNPGGGLPHEARINQSLAFEVWIHLAATFDGATIRLYRNGVLAASTPYAYTLPSSTNPFVIGSNVNTNSEQPFVGYLDDVMVYDGALSDAAVAALAAP